MKIKALILAAIMSGASLFADAQSIDEKIGKAMNASDWFALDSIYSSVPKDSIHPFLEVFSRCLIGNRLNRPEVSIPAFQELLNTHSTNLDLNNLVSSTYMFGMDLSRIGENEAAASLTNSIIDATNQYLDSLTLAGLTATANRFAALSVYKPYQIEFTEDCGGAIPFEIVPVGPKDKGAVLMHLQESSINGEQATITFDTGAGANIISPEMAEKYRLTPLEATKITVRGIAGRDGYIAIAKELRIGNICVRDVPFTVVSMSSTNAEADQYIDAFNIVIGSELMLQFKDVTIDFNKHRITVPTEAPARSAARPNLCFSSTMNLLANGAILSTPMQMCIDSGDASFGSLGPKFFEHHKDYISAHAKLDTIREAGIGGVIISECYKVPDLPVSLGGNTVLPEELTVKTDENAVREGYECILGLKTLMLYDGVRFNLVDFVLTTTKK